MVGQHKRQTRTGRTLMKDFFRELKINFARFFSLFLIVALGVAFYTGIRAAAPDMRATADNYLDQQNFMDLRLVSTLGLRETDLARIEALDLIDSVMPALTADVYLLTNDDTPVVRIHDLLDADQAILNKPLLISGRWPESENEVVVDEELLVRGDFEIGDTLTLDLPEDSIFKTSAVEVVGSVLSPAYLSLEREPTSLGTGTLSYFIYAPHASFDVDYYTDIYVTIQGARELPTYSDAYEELVKEAGDDIEGLFPAWIAERRDELVLEARSELDPHIQDLADAREEAEEEFAGNRSELDDAGQILINGQAEIDEGLEGLEELKLMHEQLSLSGDTAQAAVIQGQIDAITIDLENAQAEVDQGLRELEEAETAYNEALTEAEDEFAKAQKEIDEAEAEIADIPQGEGLVLNRDTNIGIVTYGENSNRIEAIGQVFPLIFFLVAALISLTSMSRMVEDERTQIGTLKALGYSNRQIFNKYLYFALLASLSGGLLGGFFGLYFFPYVIINAYGTLYRIPEIIIMIYPDIITLGVLFACISTISGVIIAAVPDTRLSPASLMRPPAPKPGKRIWLESVKPVWKRLSFSYKVSLRNMFRYKKRLFMTLFGIGGCTALLLTAFGLRDSVNAVVDDQFANVFHYDLSVQLDDESNDIGSSTIQAALDKVEGDTVTLNAYGQEISVLASDADLSLPLRELTFTSGVSILVAEDRDDFKEMISLSSTGRKKDFDLPDDAAVITSKLADRLDVKAGDSINISRFQGISGSAVTNGSDETVFGENTVVKVGAVTENYLGHFIYMSHNYLKTLENVHLDNLQWNNIYVRNDRINDSETADALAIDLLDIDEVSQVNFVQAQAENFSQSMETLDSVIVIIIFAAGLLAVLVLYNLNNINISERRREIATLKVLGFNRNELANYIYRENIFLMLIGILLGLVGGIFLHRYLITTVEVDLTHFGRIIKPLSWLYSIVLTIVFSLGVNFAMYNKIQKTDMVESLKSIE